VGLAKLVLLALLVYTVLRPLLGLGPELVVTGRAERLTRLISP
jgi:hypothetical protein